VNIVSAAVGRHPGDEDDGPKGRVAVMVVTSDQPVPEDVLAELVASEGFYDARTVSLPV
jgi:hypothetical protein